MARTTRSNPSPSGFRVLQTERATRSKKETKTVVSAAQSTDAPVNPTIAPAASQDEAESDAAPANPRPSSPLRRMTRAMSREVSRSNSRSVSPPVVSTVVGGAKKLLSKVGNKFTKSTKSGSKTTKQPAANTQNTTNTQSIGTLTRDKRSHSKVSVASYTSDDDAYRMQQDATETCWIGIRMSPPSKKRKNVAEEQENKSAPLETVFNTRIPKVTRNTFGDNPSHAPISVAATAAPNTDIPHEIETSSFADIGVADQSTPRHIEQVTSIPTVEAEASSPSVFRQNGKQAPTTTRKLQKQKAQRASNTRNTRTALNTTTPATPRFISYPSDEESIDIDDISEPMNDAQGRLDRQAFKTMIADHMKRSLTPAPLPNERSKLALLKNRMQHDPALLLLSQTLDGINGDEFLESCITLARWTRENSDVQLPGPEKFRAMLQAYKAELSDPEAEAETEAETPSSYPNHTPKDVTQDTSPHHRDEPAPSMVYTSPRDMVVATPSRHSYPAEVLTSTPDTVMEYQTSEVASESFLPAAPAEATPQNVAVNTSRFPMAAAFTAFSAVKSVIASPVKWFGGRSQNAVAATDTQFTFASRHPLPTRDTDDTPTRAPAARQLKKQHAQRSPSKSAARRVLSEQNSRSKEQAARRSEARSTHQANVERAEEASNSNSTLAQDGLTVGEKRKRAADTPKYHMPGTFTTPLSEAELSLSLFPADEVFPCYHHVGKTHHVPKEWLQLNNPSDPLPNPLPVNTYIPTEEEEAAMSNLFRLWDLCKLNVTKSPHSECAVALRHHWWAQISILQHGMTPRERFWDDKFRRGAPSQQYLMLHDVYRRHPPPVTYLDNDKFGYFCNAEGYYEKMRKYEFWPELIKKVQVLSVPDNESSDYEDDESLEGPPVVAVVEPAQEVVGNQRQPPPTPKQTRGVRLPYQAKTPSNLRQVEAVSLSPQSEDDVIGSENAEQYQSLVFGFQEATEVAVAGAPKDPMEEWIEGADECLGREGMTAFPDAIY
ncbi:hypothetical protein HYALB_00011689 [Hymenoscyphus albidus]|uniref:Uncharacterized protein n=1 Tax=Hymenoscyphus albidus TaxID=595503 RepID=A0A9N9LRE6_9HELO|nr:hypothetical protein HYALB_00011689 [Hymenoscyphus albidus]